MLRRDGSGVKGGAGKEKKKRGGRGREIRSFKFLSSITLARKSSHVSIPFQYSWNMVDHAMPKYMYM